VLTLKNCWGDTNQTTRSIVFLVAAPTFDWTSTAANFLQQVAHTEGDWHPATFGFLLAVLSFLAGHVFMAILPGASASSSMPSEGSLRPVRKGWDSGWAWEVCRMLDPQVARPALLLRRFHSNAGKNPTSLARFRFEADSKQWDWRTFWEQGRSSHREPCPCPEYGSDSGCESGSLHHPASGNCSSPGACSPRPRPRRCEQRAAAATEPAAEVAAAEAAGLVGVVGEV